MYLHDNPTNIKKNTKKLCLFLLLDVKTAEGIDMKFRTRVDYGLERGRSRWQKLVLYKRIERNNHIFNQLYFFLITFYNFNYLVIY